MEVGSWDGNVLRRELQQVGAWPGRDVSGQGPEYPFLFPQL